MTPEQGPLRVTLADRLLVQRPDPRTLAVLGRLLVRAA
jgi:hypothetical protein